MGAACGNQAWCDSTAFPLQPSHSIGKRKQWVAADLCGPGAFPSEVHTLSAFQPLEFPPDMGPGSELLAVDGRPGCSSHHPPRAGEPGGCA